MEDMLNSQYIRMRQAHPKEFEPKILFMYKPKDSINEVDWDNCKSLKAATVFKALTGREPDSISTATELLWYIAQKCKDKDPEKKDSDKKNDDNDLELKEVDLKVVVDGIYLVVGFLSSLIKDSNKDKYTLIHNKDVIADIIKIQNQLPMKIIDKVVTHVDEAIKQYRDEKKFETSFTFNRDKFIESVSAFCWYYSPFDSEPTTYLKVLKKEPNEEFKPRHLLDYLHFVISPKKSARKGASSTVCDKVPTAKQLKRSGVRFKGHSYGYLEVTFNDRTSTLELPALMYDFKFETVVRNLLALETLSSDVHKPVTRYFQFFNELVAAVGDVKVMRKFGLLKGSWENIHDVFQMVKRIDARALYPAGYSVLDEETKNVNRYYEDRMKRFLVRNKPALIWVSSLGAASVLLTVLARRKRSH